MTETNETRRDHLHVGPLGRHPRICGPDANGHLIPRDFSLSLSLSLSLRCRWLIHNKLDKQNGWKIAAAAAPRRSERNGKGGAIKYSVAR